MWGNGKSQSFEVKPDTVWEESPEFLPLESGLVIFP